MNAQLRHLEEGVDSRLEHELVAAGLFGREEQLLVAAAGPAGLESPYLVPGDATGPGEELELAGEAAARGDVGDPALLEDDGAGVPTLDERQGPRLAREADHLDDVGDEDVA